MEDRRTFEQFAFEEPNVGLELLPLAARRALDVAGVALSLEAWRALSLEERRALIAAGTMETVSPITVERLTPRERYALVKLAKSKKADPAERTARLEHAYTELLRPIAARLTHLNADGD